MTDAGALSDTEGSVLDPIVAIRCRITLAPGQTRDASTSSPASAETREACAGLIEKYRDRRLADRVFDLAWTHSQVVLRQLNATEADAQLYERLAGLVLYANPALRAEPAVLLRNRRGQSGLWGYAISGDLPIVLLQIADADNIELVRQLVQAHAYWRLKGLAVDLVIWNEDQAGYRQLLQDQIMGLIAAGVEAQRDRPAGRHLRAAARADLGGGPHPDAGGGARDRQRRRAARWPSRSRRRAGCEPPLPRRSSAAAAAHERAARGRDAAQRRPRCAQPTCMLRTASAASRADGREYVITHRAGQRARRRRGSTCSPTRDSARVVSARAAAPTPGARTRTSSA